MFSLYLFQHEPEVFCVTFSEPSDLSLDQILICKIQIIILVCFPKLLCEQNAEISGGTLCTAIAEDYNWEGVCQCRVLTKVTSVQNRVGTHKQVTIEVKREV